MPQSREDAERRELKDRLIDEHRRANAAEMDKLRAEVPRASTRYLDAMDQAMAILRGE